METDLPLMKSASARVSTITAPLGPTPAANVSCDGGVQVLTHHKCLLFRPSRQTSVYWPVGTLVFSLSLGEQDKSIGGACWGASGLC